MDIRKERRRLIEVEVDDTPLWQPDAVQRQQWNGLEVHWGGVTVDDPRIVRVEFRNVGRVELKESDISEPPTVEVGDATILAASAFLETGGRRAPRPGKSVTCHGNRVEVSGVLLNPGDALAIQMLLDGGSTPPVCYLHAGGFDVSTGKGVAVSR